MTAVEIINAGGGYTAGNTYDVTGGEGSGFQVTASVVADVGTSIAKLACTANLSAAPIYIGCGTLTTKGVSVRISGTSAKGHITYE